MFNKNGSTKAVTGEETKHSYTCLQRRPCSVTCIREISIGTGVVHVRRLRAVRTWSVPVTNRLSRSSSPSASTCRARGSYRSRSEATRATNGAGPPAVRTGTRPVPGRRPRPEGLWANTPCAGVTWGYGRPPVKKNKSSQNQISLIFALNIDQ